MLQVLLVYMCDDTIQQQSGDTRISDILVEDLVMLKVKKHLYL